MPGSLINNTEIISRLSDLLKYSKKYVPYYSYALPEIDQSFSTDLESYYSKIPLLSREIVRANHARLLSSEGDTSAWRKVYTTGTTGALAEFVLDITAQLSEVFLFARHLDHKLGNKDWREDAVFHLALNAGATSRANRSIWNSNSKTIKWNLLRIWQERDDNFLQALSCINDNVVTVMPSVAELICSRILGANASGKIRPRLIVLSGEFIIPGIRDKIADVFHCPVTSLYTMTEVGIVGSESVDCNSYQVESQAALVEIVDSSGKWLPVGAEGEIVITSLNNLAMPLIRYQTGDRGYWLDVGYDLPVLRLVNARFPHYLKNQSRFSINTVRFAKLLAPLNVIRYKIDQRVDGTVVFSYIARSQPLDDMGSQLVKSVIRGALGPETKIEIRQVKNDNDIELKPEGMKKSRSEPILPAEPIGPDLSSIVEWLKKQLATESQIEAAIITGSSVEAKVLSRYSDIDLMIFVKNDPIDLHWLELSSYLKSFVPKLAINFDYLQDFSQHSALLSYRLLSEQIPVIGIIDRSNLPCPSFETLKTEGLHWCQDAAAMLWLRLVDTRKNKDDLIHEAWISTKFILEALRYRYLVLGGQDTLYCSIVSMMQADSGIPKKWKNAFIEAVDVAKELKPTPIIEDDVKESYLYLALLFIREVQKDLCRETQ